MAPMPGRILAVEASIGARVEAGDPVVVLEAMKMEHAVSAPVSGMVTGIDVQVGEQVERGRRLAVVEPG
jgi:biotin carboxyl carrier protein